MSPKGLSDRNFVILAGGVGGAKLADGLSQVLPPERLTIIGNTGDDFQHLGLWISPDMDTLIYTLGGAANSETGWGRQSESWRTFDEVSRLGGPDWFKVGDLDLATHLVRTEMLNNGQSLTQITAYLAKRFSVPNVVLPMSDHPAPTLIASDQGLLPFQKWFVELGWQPVVQSVQLPKDIKATSEIIIAIENADIVVIAPSNPFVSIDPILNVYPIREMVADVPDLVIAVSPIVAGKAVKGPAAKMMREFGLEPSAETIAHYYDSLIDAFVFDNTDQDKWHIPDLQLYQTNTLMNSIDDRRNLGSQIVRITSELLDS